MKSLDAFTLIEVLITLFITIILATISFPMLKNIWQSAENNRLRDQLLQMISLAKSESQNRHMGISLCRSSDGVTCGDNWDDGYFIFVDENADGIVHDKEQIILIKQTNSAHGKLHWRSFPLYRNYIHFSPAGLTRSDNGTFWYCHEKTAVWSITMNKQGRTYVTLPDKLGKIKDEHGRVLVCG